MPTMTDNTPINLGDILSAPKQNTIFTTGRVRGWSPDGSMVILGWLGAVPRDSLRVADPDTCDSRFAALYRPATENQWGNEYTPPDWVNPVQLELPLERRGTCQGGDTIPGLEANLCRCSSCRGMAAGGVWWVDTAMQQRVLKKQTAFNFQQIVGDMALEDALT